MLKKRIFMHLIFLLMPCFLTKALHRSEMLQRAHYVAKNSAQGFLTGALLGYSSTYALFGIVG